MVSQALKCGRFGLSWWSYSVSQHSTTIPGCLCSLSHQLRGPPQNLPNEKIRPSVAHGLGPSGDSWWNPKHGSFLYPAIMAPHRINGDNFFLASPNPCRWSRMSLGPLHCKANDTKEISWSKVSPCLSTVPPALCAFERVPAQPGARCKPNCLRAVQWPAAAQSPHCPSGPKMSQLLVPAISAPLKCGPCTRQTCPWAHPSHCMGAASFQAKLRPPHECLACCHLPSSTAKVQEVIYKRIGLSKFQPCSKLESRISRLIWAWENQRYQG